MFYLILEIKRALKGNLFYISLVLNAVCLLIGIWEMKLTISVDKGYAFFYSGIILGGFTMITLLAPAIAALPFSGSFLQDTEHHFIRGVFNRTKCLNYYWRKIISTGISGALALTLPLVGLLLINLLFFGNHHPNIGSLVGPFSEFYKQKQDLVYILFIILNSGLFGFIYANLGLVATLFIPKPYVAIGIPLIVYMVPSFFFTYFGLDRFEPVTTFYLSANASENYLTVYGQLFLLEVVILVVGYLKIKRIKI